MWLNCFWNKCEIPAKSKFGKSRPMEQYRGKSLWAKSGLTVCVSSQWSWCYWRGFVSLAVPGRALSLPVGSRWGVGLFHSEQGRERKAPAFGCPGGAGAGTRAGLGLPRSACPGPAPPALLWAINTPERGCSSATNRMHGKYSPGLVKIAPAVWELFTCSLGWLPRV